jgi:undecaprenyl phosphate-alpha-L-ara4N flippase subunit ArnE
LKLDRTTLLLVAWSVVLSVSAQLLLRRTMSAYAELVGLDLVVAAATSPMIWVGVSFYLLATVSWLVVLSRIDLAVAYPLGALNYVLVTLLAATVLNDQVTLLRWIGTASILVGIMLVALGESEGSAAEERSWP